MDQESWCALTWSSWVCKASVKVLLRVMVKPRLDQGEFLSLHVVFDRDSVLVGCWTEVLVPHKLLVKGLSQSLYTWVSRRWEGEGDVSKKESVNKMEVSPLYLNHRSDLPSPLTLLVLLLPIHMLKCGGLHRALKAGGQDHCKPFPEGCLISFTYLVSLYSHSNFPMHFWSSHFIEGATSSDSPTCTYGHWNSSLVTHSLYSFVYLFHEHVEL